MTTSASSDPTLRRIFENEAAETLAMVQEQLLRLERHSDADGSRLEDLMRMAHNLKGSSRVAGLEQAGAFMHVIEARLQSWRGRSAVCADEIDLVLEAFDAFGVLTLAPDDVEHLHRIEELAARMAAPGPAPETAGAMPASLAGRVPAKRRDSANFTDHDALRVPRSRIDAVVDGAGEVLAGSFTAQAGLKGLERAMRKLVEVTLPHDAKEDLVAARRELRKAVRELRPVMHRIDQHSRRLVERSRALCLVPVAGLLVHLERVVRDAARDLGREVDVEVEGGTSNMDVALIEALKSPLAHVLRNAVDHGIEPPDERAALGKQRAGKVTLSLRQQGDRIVVAVRDDGRGIDLDAVRRRLGANGTALTPEELCRAVLSPGFTTRDEPTEISGRGIGLGAVGAIAEKLRGRVTVDTSPGHWTKVVLDLPLDLSIVRGVVVDVAGMRIVVPESGLVGLADDEDKAISLAGLLGRETDREARDGPIVVLAGRVRSVPLRVDQVLGPVEVVRRPLGKHLGRVQFVDGAAILEHGEPALILDARALADAGVGEISDPPHSETRARILVVDDSPTLLARLRSEVGAAGFDVETAEDGEAACGLLADHSFHAVVTDVQMPRLDGFCLLDRWGSELPVILVTSYPTPEGEARARRRGAIAYLTKGDDIGHVVARKLLEILPASKPIHPELRS